MSYFFKAKEMKGCFGMKQYQIFDTRWGWIWTACFLLLLAPSLLLAQADSVRVNALNPVAGEASVYQLSFVASDTLQPDGVIAVVFPSEFDLSNLKIANSTTINGGFKVSVQGNRALLQRSGLGRKVVPNEKVEIKFATIKNPSDTDGTFQATVEFFSNEQVRRTETSPITLKKKTQ